MMTYNDGEDIQIQENKSFVQSYVRVPLSKEIKNTAMKVPTCMICSMEGGAKINATDHPHKKARGYYQRTSNLSICYDKHCNIVCHSYCPEESRIKCLS